MKRKRTVYAMIILLATCLLHRNLHSQTPDEDTMKENRKQATLLLIPTALIAYGSLSHFISPLQTLNVDIRNSVQDLNIGNTTADNVIQFMPATAFFALEASRVEAKGDTCRQTSLFQPRLRLYGFCRSLRKRQLPPTASRLLGIQHLSIGTYSHRIRICRTRKALLQGRFTPVRHCSLHPRSHGGVRTDLQQQTLVRRRSLRSRHRHTVRPPRHTLRPVPQTTSAKTPQPLS